MKLRFCILTCTFPLVFIFFSLPLTFYSFSALEADIYLSVQGQHGDWTSQVLWTEISHSLEPATSEKPACLLHSNVNLLPAVSLPMSTEVLLSVFSRRLSPGIKPGFLVSTANIIISKWISCSAYITFYNMYNMPNTLKSLYKNLCSDMSSVGSRHLKHLPIAKINGLHHSDDVALLFLSMGEMLLGHRS